MSDRWEKRKHDAELKAIVKKAKQDMASWIQEADFDPSEWEIKVWQSGYIYGLNRGTGAKQ
jgi:hypothetical protein